MIFKIIQRNMNSNIACASSSTRQEIKHSDYNHAGDEEALAEEGNNGDGHGATQTEQ